MAVSAYQDLSWRDSSTIYLSHLYTLYKQDVFTPSSQLCDVGYIGYPDPIYRGAEKDYKPDFLAYSDDERDAQHIVVKEFSSSKDPDIVDSELKEVTKYKKIEPEMVDEFLGLRSISFEPEHQELVVLVPKEDFDRFEATIVDGAEEYGLNVWLIETNGNAEIWKEAGEHINPVLDAEIEQTYTTYQNGNDIIRFTRSSDRDRLKFEFTQRLLKKCARNQQRKFSFEEIDRIMIDNDPIFLGHLAVTERKDFWKQFMHSLINRFELVDGIGDNTYRWNKKKFLKEPRLRRRILSDVKEDLGLDQ